MASKPRRKRRIVVLSDGTGNSAGKLFRTNVWRLYQAIDVADGSQIARYDDGVGTSSFKPLAWLGGAMGWGLKRNVIDLYMFIARNYQSGDDIYAFGFSRGAFTVRVLISFILSQGIVDKYYSEDDLRWKAKQLYRNFRRGRKTRFGLATLGRAIRDVVVWLLAKAFRYSDNALTAIVPDKIKFIGVWDTVDAYGLPIYELKKGIDHYIWPLALEDRVLDSKIEKACHAICIDDKRKTFHPLFWDETPAGSLPPNLARESSREPLMQVFFVGVHANVGGGYPDDGLSHVPLNWMMKEATKAGLRFDKTAIDQIATNANPFGALYNSRRGFASYYRYEPRHLGPPRDHQGAVIPYPKIHESVLVRMAFGTDAYAPLAFPANSRIVVEASWADVLAKTPPKRDILTVREYRKARRTAYAQGPYPTLVRTDSGNQILSNLNSPDRHSIELIWDTVWWRRIAYFATVFASLSLLASPFVSISIVPGMVMAAFDLQGLDRAIDILSPPVVEFVSTAMSAVAPNALSPWIDAFRKDPANFLTLALVLLVCVLWGGLIDRRIRDRSFAVWNSNWRERRSDWFKASLVWRYKTALITALTSGILCSWIVIRYHVDNPACPGGLAGLGCAISAIVRAIARIIVGAALFVICAASIYWFHMLRKLVNDKNRTELIEPRGIGLSVANRIRTSSRLVGTFDFVGAHVVPALFAALVILISIWAANRASFTVLSATGSICAPTPEPSAIETERKEMVVLRFDSGCQATGFTLYAGGKYVVRVVDDIPEPSENEPEEWKQLRLELAKYPPNSPLPSYNWFVRVFAIPFRRSLSDEWFRPMIRIGATGFKEYTMDAYVGVEFTPDKDGEVFVYLNNAVIGWPSLYDAFYVQKGSIKISLERVSQDDVKRAN
jgi:uncharacterized protein (DUF2235 family)